MRPEGFDDLPGIDREIVGRRRDSFPTLVGETGDMVLRIIQRGAGREVADPAPNFPFRSWAAANGFRYPSWALPAFKQTGSAAEAYFLQAFTGTEDGAGELRDGWLVVDGVRVRPQVICRLYRIDFVAMRTDADRFRLAVEVDGMAFHQACEEQVTHDYLRTRRLAASGYTVVRFTAREAFTSSTECWRQVRAILTARA